MIIDVLADALSDCLRLLPFLFLTYLGMELLESKAGDRLQNIISRAGKSGPVWGALLGVIPQCGFSASAASLYAGRVINAGTLLAVFLSTSDEMLPIFLSSSVPAKTIVMILLAKVILAMISGFVLGAAVRLFISPTDGHMDIHKVCEHEHCDCHEGVLKSALKHTIRIAFYILVFSVVLNAVIELVGEDSLAGFLTGIPMLGIISAAIIGLIPNCAASVVLAQMYLAGVITTGAMMAGLLVGAGVGLLILFRLCIDKRECLVLTAFLFGGGVFWGFLIDLLGIVF